MASLSALTYPKKSHRKLVNLPSHSEELAELFGIMMGDGSIGSQWQATVTLNADADKEYVPFIQALWFKLFGIRPSATKRRNANAVVIRVSSTTVVDFLVDLGLPRGNKLKQDLSIPKWIYSNQSYIKACIRGLVDTDGCLYIHRHNVAGKAYRNIGLCFCSHSPPLIKQIIAIFEEFGIIAHISNQGRSIYLYRASAVAKYLETFGTSNERIRSVYREFGGVG